MPTDHLRASQTTWPHAPRKLIDIDELSTLWSVPKATLYNWVNQGRLPYVKLGRSLRFDVLAIEEFRQQSTMGVAGKG